MKTAWPILFQIIIGIVFAVVIWSTEVRCLRTFLRQYHAESFSKTAGNIIAAKVIITHGSKGRIYYHPKFAYTYTVFGQNYTGQRYRYDGFPSDQASADRIVYEHPPASAVDVYYDPSNPTEALLSPRVVAQDASAWFLINPLNLTFIYVWFTLLRNIRWPGAPEPVAGGVKILSDMMTTRARLPRYLPSLLGAATAGILSLLAGIAIQVSNTNSPVSTSLISLLVIAVAGMSVYAWQYRKIASGCQDLVINFSSRTVELPLTYKRRERRPRSFLTITAVTLEKVAHQNKSGVSYSYAPTLQFRGGKSERLTDLNKERAESFADWLRKQLGMAA